MKNHITDEQSRTVLKYTRVGSGFPLVLQHGYLGSAEMWQYQIDYFKHHFDVIAPDLSGFGQSADQPAADSIPLCASQVFNLLDALKIDQFHLLGHSMGGMIVQQMAIMQPLRIKKLICFGTGPVGVLPDRFETLDQSRRRLQTDGLEATAKHIAATWFVKGENAAGYPLCVKAGQQATMQAALASLDAWEKWHGIEALASIKAPTLIIWGDRDRSYGWSQPQALWQGIADSYLAVMPGCAHNAHLEKPGMFNLVLADFLGV